VGLEWVWGLFQPGFVRWAPLLHKTTLTTEKYSHRVLLLVTHFNSAVKSKFLIELSCWQTNTQRQKHDILGWRCKVKGGMSDVLFLITNINIMQVRRCRVMDSWSTTVSVVLYHRVCYRCIRFFCADDIFRRTTAYVQHFFRPVMICIKVRAGLVLGSGLAHGRRKTVSEARSMVVLPSDGK